MPFKVTVNNATIFLLIFLLGLIPGLFQNLLVKPILAPFSLLKSDHITKPPACACCPPESCGLAKMSWFQKQFILPSKSRGSYLITDHVVKELPEIRDYKVGLLHLFVQHTSCALSLNENWDSEVREDMSDALDRLAPEDHKGTLYRHSAEGPDDMPAHIKSALVGASVTIPISNGKLNTGTWQGIWYLEFRASKHSRKVVATIQGEKA